MSWNQIQCNWLLFKGKRRQNWAKLTDEDITRINGRRDELANRLQERYGFAKAEAEREIDAWMKAVRCSQRACGRCGVTVRRECLRQNRKSARRKAETVLHFRPGHHDQRAGRGTLSRLAMTSI